MRQAIAIANDERIEGIARIEAIVHQNIRTLLIIPLFERTRTGWPSQILEFLL